MLAPKGLHSATSLRALPLEFVPMRRLSLILPLFTACLLSTALTFAVTLAPSNLIDDDFDVDTSADYTVTGGADGSIAFAYDYSADGIPAAPNSGGSTLGVKITANDTVGASDSTTVWNNLSVPYTNYRLSIDIYMNVGASSGTTEFSGAGVAGDGAAVNSVFLPITGTGHFLSMTGEGGSGSDYRTATPGGNRTPSGDPAYLNSTNTTNATGDTYLAIFPATDFPGSPGNTWTTLTIDVVAGNITYSLDGTPIVKESFDGSQGDQVNFLYSDVFGSVANPFQSNFGIFDNLTVTEVIPEPASALLLGLASLGLVARRR